MAEQDTGGLTIPLQTEYGPEETGAHDMEWVELRLPRNLLVSAGHLAEMADWWGFESIEEWVKYALRDFMQSQITQIARARGTTRGRVGDDLTKRLKATPLGQPGPMIRLAQPATRGGLSQQAASEEAEDLTATTGA
jgi:hypothetical protein